MRFAFGKNIQSLAREGERIAGTAELNGYNTELNAVRCQALLRRHALPEPAPEHRPRHARLDSASKARAKRAGRLARAPRVSPT